MWWEHTCMHLQLQHTIKLHCKVDVQSRNAIVVMAHKTIITTHLSIGICLNEISKNNLGILDAVDFIIKRWCTGIKKRSCLELDLSSEAGDKKLRSNFSNLYMQVHLPELSLLGSRVLPRARARICYSSDWVRFGTICPATAKCQNCKELIASSVRYPGVGI